MSLKYTVPEARYVPCKALFKTELIRDGLRHSHPRIAEIFQGLARAGLRSVEFHCRGHLIEVTVVEIELGGRGGWMRDAQNAGSMPTGSARELCGDFHTTIRRLIPSIHRVADPRGRTTCRTVEVQAQARVHHDLPIFHAVLNKQTAVPRRLHGSNCASSRSALPRYRRDCRSPNLRVARARWRHNRGTLAGKTYAA